MKVLRTSEGLAIPATVATANLPKDTMMKITGNKTIDKATANAFNVGRLTVSSKTAGGDGTLETPFKEHIEIKTTELLAAGDFFKFGAPDGTTGENTAAKWVDGTDSIVRRVGVIWKGAASGGVAEALTF